MQSVLIVGGAGYVGSHAARAVAAAGFAPVVYDNLVYGHRWAVNWGPLIVGDIADRGRLEDVIREHRPVAVMHFAAYTYVGESVKHPDKYYRNNVGGTLSLLEACKATGVERVVFSSTCATYGVPERVPIDESNPQRPINSYGRSKLMIEQVLDDYHTAYGLSYAALRYFNAAGACLSDERLGEAHDPETHLIPLACLAAMGAIPPLQVFGEDYPTKDGTCLRDYIHVDDLADAHVAAMRRLLDAPRTALRLNLGTGDGYTVREVIDAVSNVSGKQVPYTMGPRRDGDSPALVANTALAEKELGWKARHGLPVIAESAWRWHQRTRPTE